MPAPITRCPVLTLSLLAALVMPGVAAATPEFVEHHPGAPVYGEPFGTTFLSPLFPREDEGNVLAWARIGYSFFYTDVAVYYTTDGSDPQGSLGVPGNASTQVLRSSAGEVTFVRNESTPGGQTDWWKAAFPPHTRAYQQTVRYTISAWHSGGGIEVFSNNTGCSDNVCDDPAAPRTIHWFTNKLAWPGQGSAFVNHAVGYPPVWTWKEEAVVGNNNINVQLDQNGSYYDVYWPSAGNVQGVSTKNEGYSDGNDTFPPGLPTGFRGQMHLNQAFLGLRVDGRTYWLTNQTGADYSDLTQAYVPGTNSVVTQQRLTAAGNNISVQQIDFSPKGITFPTWDDGVTPNKGLSVKRVMLTNHGASSKDVNVYFYMDPALNGGDAFDAMGTDPARGIMYAYDRTQRLAGNVGEYNPTSFPNYDKNVSVYLGAAMKLCTSVGSATGAPAADSWRDTSGDDSQGWIGMKVTLAPGQTREVDIALIGGFDPFAGATGTYAYQMDGAADWFQSTSMGDVQGATDSYWQNWLASGVTVNLPDPRWNQVFSRGLLATALHLDEKGGGVIAGYHNGAYPFVWPRDAVYAAVTLARTGHTAESAEVYRFLRDVCYRDSQGFSTGYFGRAFWYQKYTTDGYRVWTAPQVDETSVYPWGIRFQYRATGDAGFLNSHYLTVYEAGLASSEDSTIDPRLRFEDSVSLMYSNNVWEDQFDVFIYSNASVERGLRDASAIASVLGYAGDAALFDTRADQIHSGLLGRLAWDGENTDISQLGLVYPFKVFAPDDPLVAHVVDRMNGVASDRNGHVKPLMNYSGEFAELLDRYWCDGYWNGGMSCSLGQPTANPWFLSTLWYGMYYASRADVTPGTLDIDNHRLRVDRCLDRLGPAGLGAEQIAPTSSLLYPGQDDFRLQAAWPNAWESMSTLVDAVMSLAGFTPDAPSGRFALAPKLPTGWGTMTFNNLRVGAVRFNVTPSEDNRGSQVAITNLTGGSLTADLVIRVPPSSPICSVERNGAPVAYSYNAPLGRVSVTASLSTGAGSQTTVRVHTRRPADINADGVVNTADLTLLLGTFGSNVPPNTGGDVNGDGVVNTADLTILLGVFGQGC